MSSYKAILIEGADVENENTVYHILETELNYATERENEE